MSLVNTSVRNMGSRRWSIILAGGDGRRVAEYCDTLYEDGRPKQFCAFQGAKTMVEQTIDRGLLFAPANRTLVSICKKHVRWRDLWAGSGVDESIQPQNADTGPGVLLASLEIERRSGDSTVVLLPSDHHVSDDGALMRQVQRAADWVERHPDKLILLGAKALYPEPAYGWLLPDRNVRSAPAGTPIPAHFIEKPSEELAERLLAVGAYWNTFVVVYRTSWMLRLMALLAPRWTRAMTNAEPRELSAIYRQLPSFNLSSGILQRAKNHVRVMPLDPAIHWSDLGSEERIQRVQTGPEHARVAER